MDCQLENLPAAGADLGRLDRFGAALRQARGRLLAKVSRVGRDPRLLAEKLRLVQPRPIAHRPASPAIPAPLRLQAGERVRIKTIEEIRATLDDVGDCEGLGFMPVQEAFCGRVTTVRKRVDRFFDERTRRMLKLRDTVILDEVFCEPPASSDVDYAGCARTCFLFWKEAWLERV